MKSLLVLTSDTLMVHIHQYAQYLDRLRIITYNYAYDALSQVQVSFSLANLVR